MSKLKALRGAIGSYGRVAAGGIIDVDEATADKLLKTKRFVRASDHDIEAAQKAQKLAMSVQSPGAGDGFMPVPNAPMSADRLSQMIERGEISRDKAKELVAHEISLSTEEVQAFIKDEADKLAAQIDADRAELDARELELDKREQDLADRERAAAAAGATETKEVAPEAKETAEAEAKADADAKPKAAKASK